MELVLLSQASNYHLNSLMFSPKGYEEVSQKFTSIRRVRGDNYCALRATLFQAMSQLAELPLWLQDPELTLVCCCTDPSLHVSGSSCKKISPFCSCCLTVLYAAWFQCMDLFNFACLRWLYILRRWLEIISVFQKRKVIKLNTHS